MKAIIAFFALFALANCAHQFYYAGTTNSSDAGTSPTAPYAIVTGGVCTVGTASGYQKYTINATANSFYYVTTLFQDPTVDYGQTQVYSTAFVPATPCLNLAFLDTASNGAPHTAILTYVTPGLYDVVITTSLASYAGVFAAHADRTDWIGSTSSSSNYWYYPYGGYTYCSISSYEVPYTSRTFTVAAAGYYDILVFAYNSTQLTSVSIIAALYNETAPSFVGTGNATNPASPCVGSFVRSEDEETSITKVSQNNYAATIIDNVMLVPTTNYTVVLSSDYYYDSYIWGVWTRKTVVGALTNTGFLTPAFGVVGEDTCSPDTTPSFYTPIVFTAQYSTYVIDNGLYGFDTAACLYSGVNVGTAIVPPTPCPPEWLQCIDSGDVGPLHQLGTRIGTNYTIVQTTYSAGGSSIGAGYTLYVYTGTQLGPLPVSTTAVPTTGEASSSASAIIASFALIAIAALF